MVDNQTPTELPVEMPPEDVASVNEPPVYEQKAPVLFPIIAVVFIVVVMGVIAVAVLSSGKRTPSNNAQAPTVTPAAKAYKTTGSSSASIEAGPTPILENIPASYLPLILEVSAVGGGAQGERNEYIVNLKPATGDALYVIKADETSLSRMPKYSKGATDTGLRVSHGKSYLDIVPVFEGAGTGLPKKIPSTSVKSKINTSRLIRRIAVSDLPGSLAPKGFIYTTQYVEDAKSCSAFSASGSKTPACILSGWDIEPKDAGPLNVTCVADNADLAWCDSIVNGLSFIKNETSSSSSR